MAKRKSSVKRKASFSHRDFLMYILVFALVGAFALWVSFAAPSCNKSKGCISALHLTNEYKYWPDTWSPNCLTEDDQDFLYYSGSLDGSFSSTYRECGLSTDGWTSGGEGLEADVSVSGTLTDLTITSPTGEVHHAEQMTSSFIKGKSTNYYAVCFVPSYYLSTDTATGTLTGGTYTITLSGQISNATYTTRADMTDVNFQKQYCPASQQRLL